jgi:site-specific DNA recombinase
VHDLKKALAEADEDSHAAAYEAIREIVEKVVIHPRGRYKSVEIETYGHSPPCSAFSRGRLTP